MSLRADDFVLVDAETDPWTDAVTKVRERFDVARLQDLVNTPDPQYSDLEVALALVDLVRDDLHRSGTDGKELSQDSEMRVAIRALARVTARTGHELNLPFTDHSSWRSWWIRQGARNSWQARRELLGKLFDETYAQLLAAHDRALDATLLEAVTPHARIGWPEIDTEIGEMRRHFRNARSPQDYAGVGLDCVRITEALSRQIYNHETHTPPGETEPPWTQSKIRMERFIENRLPGPSNAALRKFARSSIELAQAQKHSITPTRTEAGIVADAVIALSNMLRRLAEDS